ncbi:MAG: hypothetical protein VZR27_07650 [Acutalibacteraceae bacterium]|nr:hypothetical protein [Acutalibacteraceae bacterium]
MNDQKRIIKDLKRFACNREHWALLILLLAFSLIPGIMDFMSTTKYGVFMGESKNGYLVTVIGIILSVAGISIYARFAASDFEKIIKAVDEDGLLDVLLKDYEKNKQVLFLGQVILGNTFIIKRQSSLAMLIMPYSAIQAVYLERASDEDNKVFYYICVTSADKRYQSALPPRFIALEKTAKTDYDTFCAFIREKNPNVYFGFTTDKQFAGRI